MACPSCVVELVPPFPSLRFGTKVSAHKKAKVQGQETHARVMPRRDNTNASSSIFFKSHHGILELVSSVTLGSIIQGSPGLEHADKAQVGQKTGHRAPNESTCQMQRGENSPDYAVIQSCMSFIGVCFHLPAVHALL